MKRLKRTGVVAIALAALLVSSSVAWADDEIDEAPGDTADTTFNFGYDLINRVLVWSIAPLGGQYDCSLEGTLTATYGEGTDEGTIPVDDLQGDDGTVSFPATPEDELDEGVEPAEGPVTYEGSDGPCGVVAGEVSGPNGQVNHGMFMKLFNSLYEGQGRGCIVRHLAQSDLGKGPQKVKAGEDAIEPVTTGDTGVIDFTSVETTCEKKWDSDSEGDLTKNDKSNKGKSNKGKGKPESPGKSGSAPGKNK